LRFSSTIIEDVRSLCQSDSALKVAYFYFDFRDIEKQRSENFIRSAITQLSAQSVEVPEALEMSYSRNRYRQLSGRELVATLKSMLECSETYIILDALDECIDRPDLLKLIQEIYGWDIEKKHILATSRRERCTEDGLESSLTGQICIQSAFVEADLRIYIHEQFQRDPVMMTWPETWRNEVEETLVSRADGM
jgi:hypothetical protein